MCDFHATLYFCGLNIFPYFFSKILSIKYKLQKSVLKLCLHIYLIYFPPTL